MRDLVMVSLAVLMGVTAGQADEPATIVADAQLPGARQPQPAVDPAGNVFVAFGAHGAVYCTASADKGKTFGTPVKIAHFAKLALGKRRGPRIAATEKAVVITAIAGEKQADTLFAWRSTDQGKSWQGPTSINRIKGSAAEGLHGMAAAPDGTIHCVWQDFREGNGQFVYGSHSADGGATWAPERRLYKSPDGGVCPCCAPVVACDAKGGVHVLWRNDLGGARDMYLMSSNDGGKSFGPDQKLGDGTWPFDSCPMDSGGLAADEKGRVRTIWRRDRDLFACTAGEPERLLGRGEQGCVAIGPDGFHMLWLVNRPGRLMALLPDWSMPRKLADNAADPACASNLGRAPVVAVWEEGKPGSVRLRCLVLYPPR